MLKWMNRGIFCIHQIRISVLRHATTGVGLSFLIRNGPTYPAYSTEDHQSRSIRLHYRTGRLKNL